MKLNWRLIAALVFAALFIILQIAYWIDPVTLKDFVSFRDELIHLVQLYPTASACIYIGVYVFSIMFGLPVSATIVGGYLFDVFYGVIYTTIAVIIGSTILCLFARYVIYKWIEEKYKKKLGFFNSEIKKYGALYIVMVHAIPFAPSFLPHIAAGLSSLALYKIILANAIGALPLTILYAAAGANLHSLTSLRSFVIYVTIFGGGLVALWVIVLFARYIFDKKS